MVTFFLGLFFDEGDEFEGRGGLIVELPFDVEIGFGELLVAAVGLFCVLVDFLKFVEELLGVRSNLGSRSSPNVLFYFFPVLAVLHDGCG